MSRVLRSLLIFLGIAAVFGAGAGVLFLNPPTIRTAAAPAANDADPAVAPQPAAPSAVFRAVLSELREAVEGQTSAAVAVGASRPATRIEARRAALEAVWSDWRAAHDVSDGAMALILPDGALHSFEDGRRPSDVYPVASLSKAITGLCLDQVLTEHGLTWQTRLGDIAEGMSARRVTPQPWSEHITLAQLVTHTSGLSPDHTQGELGLHLHGALGLHRRVAWTALQEDAIQGEPGTFYYSNTNYAVLGIAIEALTGEDYAQACMSRVVTPAGVDDAIIQGRVGSASSYAGWEFSAEGYARLLQHWFGPGSSTLTAPAVHTGQYALGYRLDGSGSGALAHHGGILCTEGRFSWPDVGAYFMVSGDGTIFAANWAGCLPDDAYVDLNARLAAAMR